MAQGASDLPAGVRALSPCGVRRWTAGRGERASRRDVPFAAHNYLWKTHSADSVAAPVARTRVVVAESNLRGYRGLTLDAFGSLLEDGPGHVPAALDRIVQELHVGLDPPALSTLWREAIRHHRETEPFQAYREVHRRAFHEIFDRLGIRSSVDDPVDETFEGYRRAKAFPEVTSVLNELEREVPIAVVSNMDTRLLLEVLQNNGLAFTFVITSEEEQRYKPALSLFRRAVRYLGLPAAHVLHIGDSYDEDVVGATSAGMGALRIRRGRSPTDPPEDRTGVDDLRGVQNVLRESWKD